MAARAGYSKPIPDLWPLLRTLTELVASIAGVKNMHLEDEFKPAPPKHKLTQEDHELRAILCQGMGTDESST